MTTALEQFEIRLKTGRRLIVRGSGPHATHQDYGNVTYFVDNTGKRIFQAPAAHVLSVMRLGPAEGPLEGVSTDGSDSKPATYRVVRSDGSTVVVPGIDSFVNHRDYGCRAYVLDASGNRTFDFPVGDLALMYAEYSVRADTSPSHPRVGGTDDPTEARQVFVSHVSEDENLALELVSRLEALGYSTWYYERDGLPGLSYLTQVCSAIERCTYFLVLISTTALSSRQMEVELERAHEAAKPIIPIRHGLAHDALQRRRPLWRQALGTATSIEVSVANIDEAVARIDAGLRLIHETSGQQPHAADAGKPRR